MNGQGIAVGRHRMIWWLSQHTEGNLADEFLSIRAQAQWFLSIFSEIGNLFALSRHTVSAANHRLLLNKSLGIWSNITQGNLA